MEVNSIAGYEGNQHLRTSDSPTFSKLTLGSGDDTLVFDGGDNQINTHDGFGNFNIKSGVDGNNNIVSTTGGSHIRLDESGRIALQIDESTAVGGSFSTGLSLTLDSDIVDISGGNLDMSSGKITGLATPTADSDAATKAYVDAAGDHGCQLFALGSTSCNGYWCRAGTQYTPNHADNINGIETYHTTYTYLCSERGYTSWQRIYRGSTTPTTVTYSYVDGWSSALGGSYAVEHILCCR
jgi:hypothetical protein